MHIAKRTKYGNFELKEHADKFELVFKPFHSGYQDFGILSPEFSKMLETDRISVEHIEMLALEGAHNALAVFFNNSL